MTSKTCNINVICCCFCCCLAVTVTEKGKEEEEGKATKTASNNGTAAEETTDVKKPAGGFNCPECKDWFPTLVPLRKHLRDKHGQ